MKYKSVVCPKCGEEPQAGDMVWIKNVKIWCETQNEYIGFFKGKHLVWSRDGKTPYDVAEVTLTNPHAPKTEKRWRWQTKNNGYTTTTDNHISEAEFYKTFSSYNWSKVEGSEIEVEV